MPRRHALHPADPASVATRLDELLSAGGGADPFGEAVRLLVARRAWEAGGGAPGAFLADGAAPGAVDALLDAARARWPGVVEAGARCGLAAPVLARAAEALRGARLGDDDGLDALFEQLVARVAKGEKGQFFTPRHVVDAAVAMVAPRPGERVLDPACGSGAFLVAAAREAPGARVLGVDLDGRAARVARVALALAGVPPGGVRDGDALAPDGPLGDAPRGVDVVLANPPFAGDVGPDAYPGYALGRDRRVERDVLFLERCVSLLRPGGRLAVVLPNLLVGGARHASVRDWLSRHARVVAVIGLGRETFLPHTAQKAVLLVAVRRATPLAAPPADERVGFAVSARPGKDRSGRVLRRPDGRVDHDLDALIPAVRAAVDAAEAAEAAHATEPRPPDSAPRPAAIPASPSAPTLALVPPASLAPGLVLAPERYDPRRAVAGAAPLRLGDAFDLLVPAASPARLGPGPVVVLDTSHAQDGFVVGAPPPGPPPAGHKRPLRPGDVLVSRLRPYLRQVALVDPALFARAPGGNAVVASTEFYVIRPRAALPAAALVPLLLSAPVQAALAAAQEGGHHPRVPAEALAALPLPDRWVAEAPALAAAVEARVAALRATLDAHDAAVAAAGALLGDGG